MNQFSGACVFVCLSEQKLNTGHLLQINFSQILFYLLWVWALLTYTIWSHFQRPWHWLRARKCALSRTFKDCVKNILLACVRTFLNRTLTNFLCLQQMFEVVHASLTLSVGEVHCSWHTTIMFAVFIELYSLCKFQSFFIFISTVTESQLFRIQFLAKFSMNQEEISYTVEMC